MPKPRSNRIDAAQIVALKAPRKFRSVDGGVSDEWEWRAEILCELHRGVGVENASGERLRLAKMNVEQRLRRQYRRELALEPDTLEGVNGARHHSDGRTLAEIEDRNGADFSAPYRLTA